MLRCPHCRGALHRRQRTWTCPSGHAFDIARQGYVNLLPGASAHRGDSAAMLDARQRVLATGLLDDVTEAVVAALRDLPPGALVEVGAGTGHHLQQAVAATGRPGLTLDVSTAAARRAARAGPDVTAVVADVWQPWPVADASAAAVLHVFAPRNLDEAYRVLVPDGAAVVTVPTDAHLRELRGIGLLGVGDAARKRPDHPGLVPDGVRAVRVRRVLSPLEVRDVVAMGPSAHHVPAAHLDAAVATLPDRVDVSVSVDVLRLRRG